MIHRQQNMLPTIVMTGRPVDLRIFKAIHFIESTDTYTNMIGIVLYTFCCTNGDEVKIGPQTERRMNNNADASRIPMTIS